MATDGQTRNKLRITGAVAGLCVWTALSGVGSLSAPAGFFLGLLTWWMLTGVLVWAVCKGDTGGRALPPVNEGEGLPGWLLVVVVLALLVWIGLSGVGDMSGSAGFVFALLAMIGLTGLVLWARSGDDGEDSTDHRFAMLPEEDPAEEPPGEDASASEAGQAALAGLASPAAEPAAAQAAALSAGAALLAQAGPEIAMADGAAGTADAQAAQARADTMDGRAPDGPAAGDLRKIKGIGPALEKTLHEAGVTRLDQIAAWDQADMDAMAARLGRMGGRIRHDDWVGQARALCGAPAADKG